MSYVVIRGCTEKVDMAAFGRWLRRECSTTPKDVVAVIEQLYAGHRYTVFLGEKDAKWLMQRADRWGLTGVTLHDDDDMSEYPPPAPLAGFWMRWWQRLRS
jgi:hypothetical protein